MITDFQYRNHAKSIYGSNDVEFDTEAKISRCDDGQNSETGAWVQAWVFVNEEDAE